MAERLHHATAEGRLTAVELDQRLEVLYRTRTYDELDALVADLPASTPARVGRAGVPVWVAATGAVAVLLTALGLVSVALLTVAVRRSAVVVGGPGNAGQLRLPVAPPEAHHLMIAAASRAAVLAVCVVVAVVVLVVAVVRWLMRARHAPGT